LILGAVLSAAGAFAAGSRADTPRPAQGPTPAPGPVAPNSSATLQARVAALEARVTVLENYVQAAKSACTQFDLDLRAQGTGFKCQTKKGKIFERVSRNGFGEAWKAPDGTVWSDIITFATTGAGVNHSISFDDAKKRCSDMQSRLPSPGDMQNAYTSGFLEVDPAGSAGLRWWTSTTSTGTALVAGGQGGIAKQVQQVGDIVASIDPGYVQQWTQITPVFNSMTGTSATITMNTRCISS
jgi:hypothetical protein